MVAGLLLFCPISAHAEGGVPLWTNISSGSTFALAVDNSGNVFVTGSASNGTNSDYATIKYSNSGVPLWTNRYNGDFYDAAYAIAVDASGNVFVTGQSFDGPDADPATTSSSATVAYSNTGVPLWTNRYKGSIIGSSANAIAVDGGGNVFVTGTETLKYSNAGMPLWTNRTGAGSIALDSNGNVFVTGNLGKGSLSDHSDYLTIKYSNAGVPLWTNRYNGGFDDYVADWAIAVDSIGNVFVTGRSSIDSLGPSSEDFATVAYSNSGVPLWTNRYDGPANRQDSETSIAVDSNGNVFVTGYSSMMVFDPVFGYLKDYAAIKYSNSGVPLWTNYYDGPAGDSDYPQRIAVDAAGSVFVTGFSLDVPCCPQSAALETIAYSNAGDLIWENRYYGPDNRAIYPRGIALDRTGNVIVTGYSGDGGSSSYSTTIKYSSSLPPPFHLDFQKQNNELVLSWTNAGFNLQFAPAVTGPFTNLPAATSPYTNALTGPQQYFRLKGN